MGRLLGAGAKAVATAFGLVQAEDALALSRRMKVQHPVSAEERVEEAAMDSLGVCSFAAETLRGNTAAAEALADMLNSLYGLDMDIRKLTDLGRQVLALEESFNSAYNSNG
jgi:aldehyde:ferredoxin oxidoreductase